MMLEKDERSEKVNNLEKVVNNLEKVDNLLNLLKLLDIRKKIAQLSIIIAIIWAILIPFHIKDVNNLSKPQNLSNTKPSEELLLDSQQLFLHQELFFQIVSIVFALSMSALVSTYALEAYLDDEECFK